MAKSILTAIAGLLLITGPATAAVLVNETFNHPDGNLVGLTPTPGPGGTWAAHSGAGTGPIQVSGGAAVVRQATGASEDVNTALGTPLGAGGKLYAGFDLTVEATGAPTNVYFAMFMEGTSLFDGRIWITAPTANGYRLAISNDNSITDNDGEVFTNDLAFGTRYRIIHSYDYDGKSATLWVNPVNESSPSVTATDPGFSDEVSAYAFRQAGGNSTQTIDNLIVATSFSEAVPEPATLALLGLGCLVIRRRRPA